MPDTIFIDGLIVKEPHPNAPDFVKAKLSIKREELISWLQQQQGEWINADIKQSRGGKWYAAVDTWEPDATKRTDEPFQDNPPPADDYDDSIPF